jgi:hypothetical protein
VLATFVISWSIGQERKAERCTGEEASINEWIQCQAVRTQFSHSTRSMAHAFILDK